MKTRGERLRWARLSAGYRSALSFATEHDLPVSTYNSHERAQEPGGRDYDFDRAQVYARILHQDAVWLMTGRGSPKLSAGTDPEMPGSTIQLIPRRRLSRPSLGVKYAGIAEAGTFREQYLYGGDTSAMRVPIARDLRYDELEQYAWLVNGDSMDRAGLFDGMYAVGVPFHDFVERFGEPQNGTIVVVQRSRFDGQEIELSVKEMWRMRDRMEFRPNSSNAAHKPIVVNVDHQADDGLTVTVIAVVIGGHRLFGPAPMTASHPDLD